MSNAFSAMTDQGITQCRLNLTKDNPTKAKRYRAKQKNYRSEPDKGKWNKADAELMEIIGD
jgi:hypothetical protein